MAEDTGSKPVGILGRLREESPFVFVAATFLLFQFFADDLLKELTDPFVAAGMFALIFAAMLTACFGVVRHADALAELLGEPYGTLILTLSVIGIEVSLIAAVMLAGEGAPTLARDTMFAVLMIVLNGLVGLALLLGALRHKEQDYNLQGARAFMAVLMPLSVFALVLPKFTTSTTDPTYTDLQEAFFALVTLLLYAAFLTVQTMRHQGFFMQPVRDGEVLAQSDHGRSPLRSVSYHTVFLLLTLLPIVLLSKRLAKLVDFGIAQVGAPAALGGVIIALLVLTPEGLAGLKAARANYLQRSVNLLLGSAVATIGLTVPAVLIIAVVTNTPVILGLDDAFTVILVLTLVMSSMTFGGVRTSVLQGAVHLVLFFAYLMLIFSP